MGYSKRTKCQKCHLNETKPNKTREKNSSCIVL